MAKQSNQCHDIVRQEFGIGPVISQNVCKVLEECIRSAVIGVPPTGKAKDKDRVRRPMNAFMLYSQTARKLMAKVYPTLSYRKLSKVLGQIWKVMDPEEKKPFIVEAERLRILHKKQHPDFKFTTNKPRPAKPKGPGGVKKSKTESVPTFQDLLELVNPDMTLFTEPKLLQTTSQPFFNHSENIPHPPNNAPLPYNNDQEILFILDSLLNDATGTTSQPNTATPMQFAAMNNAVSCYIPTNHPVGQQTPFAPPFNQNSDLLTRVSSDNPRSTHFPCDLSAI